MFNFKKIQKRKQEIEFIEPDRKNFIKSKRGLFPHQILLIEYCSYGTYPNPKNGYPRFWKTKYEISDIDRELYLLEEKGFIYLDNGKYKLTDLGKEELKNNQYVIYIHKHNDLCISMQEMNFIMQKEKRNYRDVIWGILNKNLMFYSKDKKWGYYRNTLQNMAGILEEENKYIDALLFYCEVMFLDINVLSKNIPANNKRQELCMPVGIINKISKLRKITEISEYEFLSLINERFENIYNSNCVLTKEQTIDLINCRTR